MIKIEINHIIAKSGGKVFDFLDIDSSSINTSMIPLEAPNRIKEEKILCLLRGIDRTEFETISCAISLDNPQGELICRT